MEKSLGAPLLVRSRQGVVPTPAGRTLLQHARALLAQAERLREDLGAFAGGLAGQIRILSNTNALTEFLPEALGAFLTSHPQVSIDLEERLSDEIVGLVAEGVGDIGIVAGTVDTGRLVTYPFSSEASTRCAAWWKRASGSASCPRPPRSAPPAPWRSPSWI
jgi:DNA-binding transcriptional LysR family regulator